MKCLAEPPQGAGAVFVLGPAFFRDHDQAAGQMPDAHRRARLVALLPSRPAGPIGVHLALFEQLGITQLCPTASLHLVRRSLELRTSPFNMCPVPLSPGAGGP